VIYHPRKARSSGRFWSQKKCAPRAAEGTWFGCGFSRGCSSGSKAILWTVPRARGPGPPTPRRLDRPLVASEAAPGPRRTPGHCLRASISKQCPGTTGCNENKALPFPRTGNRQRPAARRGASRVWPPKWGVLGPCFAPTPTPHRPRRLKQIDPPQGPRAQERYCSRGLPDAPPGQPNRPVSFLSAPISSYIRPHTNAPACTCIAALSCKDKETSCLVSLRLLTKKYTI
jgi:hypothetical protein